MTQLTFYALALNLVPCGYKVGGRRIDLGGVRTAIVLDQSDDSIYVSILLVPLARVV